MVKLDIGNQCMLYYHMKQHFLPSVDYSLFLSVSLMFLFSFLTAQGSLQFSPRGLRPSCSLMTARHLDQNTMGYLQWRWGHNSAMTTSLVRDTKSSHFTLALQVYATCKHTYIRSEGIQLPDFHKINLLSAVT